VRGKLVELGIVAGQESNRARLDGEAHRDRRYMQRPLFQERKLFREIVEPLSAQCRSECRLAATSGTRKHEAALTVPDHASMNSHEVPVAVDSGLSHPGLDHANQLVEPHTVANRQEILEQQMTTVRLQDVQDHVDRREDVDLEVGESRVHSGSWARESRRKQKCVVNRR
jgi:hypothetical protein